MAQKRLKRTVDPQVSLVWSDTGPTDSTLNRYIDASLHCNFKPHQKQLEVIQAVVPSPLGRGIRRAFLKCGRKWGKSRFGCYIAHRFCTYFPGKRVYILAPEQKQAAEIYWKSGEVPEFMTYAGERNKLIQHTDEQGLRQIFINGSFIKVDGSDNYRAQRGYNPDVIIADEFGDFDSRWWDDVVPNLIARNGWLILLGTPPREPLLPNSEKHLFVQIFEDWTEEMLNLGTAYTGTGTSFDNSSISREVIDKEIRRLEKRGDYVTIKREYFGEIVYGGKNAIFPTFLTETHVAPHEEIISRLKSNPERFEYYALVDPGTTSVFAGLFIAYDRYTATPYFLDNIYETTPQACTVDTVVPNLIQKCEEFYPGLKNWQLAYDSAAAWFCQEAIDRYGLAFAPTRKREGDKLEGISLFRDLLALRRRFISDRCQALITEISNYKTNERGALQKEWDHLIDLIRYFLRFANVSLNQTSYQEPEVALAKPRRPKPYYSFRENDDDVNLDDLIMAPSEEYLF